MEKPKTILMQKYEIGKLLGQGTFAKVYHARNLKTGENVAIKIIEKGKVIKIGLIDQIKREISVMRLVKHANVVQLYEVMASKTKIYFAMEYVKGGELFNKVAKGKLKEETARKYFQQLIEAIEFCHSRGVYHRDLKPENLLLDEDENLKISDFGLSALTETIKQDGLLHTTCGTPAYVAPEVIGQKGYDGAKADIWSCGVILYVLLAGFLPFQDRNLVEMYRKITKGEFRCPNWFHPESRKLISRILDPNPRSRITLLKLMDNYWFKKGFKRIETSTPTPTPPTTATATVPTTSRRESLISDLDSAFDLNTNDESCRANKQKEGLTLRPSNFNAFDIISLSPGFDLSGLFEKDKSEKAVSRFTTKNSASDIMSKFEKIAMSESFSLEKREGTLKMQHHREGRKGQLAIDAEVFEVTSSFHVVEFKKRSGDTMEYREFCDRELKPSLKDIVWAWGGNEQQSSQQQIVK